MITKLMSPAVVVGDILFMVSDRLVMLEVGMMDVSRVLNLQGPSRGVKDLQGSPMGNLKVGAMPPGLKEKRMYIMDASRVLGRQGPHLWAC